MRCRITRDGKPIGLCPSDAIVEADTPMDALLAAVPAYTIWRRVTHVGMHSAEVVISGCHYEATEVRDA